MRIPILHFNLIGIRILPLTFFQRLGPLRLPAFHFDADPDPAFHFGADPDPTFHSYADADPDLAP
jgi:hypothetical protein